MWCTIRIQGHLSEQWAHWFGDLSISNQPGGEAILSGELADQSALYSTLGRLRDMGIVLLALECRRPARAGRRSRTGSGALSCGDPNRGQ